MRIKNLSLTNYRGTTSLSVDFHPKMNVLAGINGSGKSTILDAIATMLTWAVSRIRRSGKQGRHIEEIHITNHKPFASIQIQCSLDTHQFTEWRLSKSRQGYGKPEIPSNFESLNSYTKKIQEEIALKESKINLPLFVYYGVNRAISGVNIRLKARKQRNFDLLNAYNNSFDVEVNFTEFFQWFREREDFENEIRRDFSNADFLNTRNGLTPPCFPDPQLEAVRQAIEKLMPGFSGLIVRRSPLRMEISKNNEALIIQQLSDGEKCWLALVGDLARRLAIANPCRSNPLEGEGIILIDELDLHLHPTWQINLISGLTEVFPNCQFVVSTHSPHVLTHTKPDRIFLLERLPSGEITIRQPSKSYGKTADMILMDLMGLKTTRPQKVDDAITRLYSYIDNGDLHLALNQLNAMKYADNGIDDVEFIDEDPVLIRAEHLIKRKEKFGK